MHAEHADLSHARKALAAGAKVKSRWDSVKLKGVEFFDVANRKLVDELFRLLNEVGLFVVPREELEGWLRLGIAKGARWNRTAMERLHAGECPDDLSAFMRNVLKYLQQG